MNAYHPQLATGKVQGQGRELIRLGPEDQQVLPGLVVFDPDLHFGIGIGLLDRLKIAVGRVHGCFQLTGLDPECLLGAKECPGTFSGYLDFGAVGDVPNKGVHVPSEVSAVYTTDDPEVLHIQTGPLCRRSVFDADDNKIVVVPARIEVILRNGLSWTKTHLDAKAIGPHARCPNDATETGCRLMGNGSVAHAGQHVLAGA